MKVDRERDALIAEKVMGELDKINEREYRLMIPSGVTLPHYSTQIADAWQVVEKLNLPFTLQKNKQFKGGHYASFIVDKRFEAAQADTAPLAICLAALKAVE